MSFPAKLPPVEALTLSLVVHTEIRQAKLLDILLQGVDLCSRIWLGDERGHILEVLSRDGSALEQSELRI